MSRRRRSLLLGFGAILIFSSRAAPALAEDSIDREYRIKAAFVYNFLKFVEGGRFAPPQDKTEDADPNDPNDRLVVGVLGVPPSRIAFDEFQGKKVGPRLVQIQWFKSFTELADEEGEIPEQYPELETIRKCRVLFVCPSERAFLQRILPPLRDSGILTVGDVPLFLETGGVINLLIEEKKIRFEVNLAAAARAQLVIRSSLLRLAARTLEHDRLETREDQENSGGSSHP
jgi:hypothetical protein